jgi:hypothetical protein
MRREHSHLSTREFAEYIFGGLSHFLYNSESFECLLGCEDLLYGILGVKLTLQFFSLSPLADEFLLLFDVRCMEDFKGFYIFGKRGLLIDDSL